jgi:hypothetical protein
MPRVSALLRPIYPPTSTSCLRSDIEFANAPPMAPALNRYSKSDNPDTAPTRTHCVHAEKMRLECAAHQCQLIERASMLFFALALAQSIVPQSTVLDIICTAPSYGRTITFRFSIDETSKTFTGRSNDLPLSGTAELTDDKILLVDRGDKLTWYYELNRLTGSFTMSGTRNNRTDRHGGTSGSCRRFTGQAF